jgi:hypothetical protein
VRAFQLRAKTSDLQADSQVVLITEEGRVFEIIKVETRCRSVEKKENGEEKNCYPEDLYITIKSVVPDEKKAGRISQTVHV